MFGFYSRPCDANQVCLSCLSIYVSVPAERDQVFFCTPTVACGAISFVNVWSHSASVLNGEVQINTDYTCTSLKFCNAVSETQCFDLLTSLDINQKPMGRMFEDREKKHIVKTFD